MYVYAHRDVRDRREIHGRTRREGETKHTVGHGALGIEAAGAPPGAGDSVSQRTLSRDPGEPRERKEGTHPDQALRNHT